MHALAVGLLASAVPKGLVDCTVAAAGLFNNVRITATLLSGAALSCLWVKFDGGRFTGRQLSMLQLLYTVLVSVTVALELSAVFMATAMGVRLQAGGFDALASNAVSMLVREFETSYIAVRIHFVTGMGTFVASLALRVYVSFPPPVSRACGFLLLATIFHFYDFFATTVVNYDGYTHMVLRLCQLCAQNALPLTVPKVAWAGCVLASVYNLIRGLSSSAAHPKAD